MFADPVSRCSRPEVDDIGVISKYEYSSVRNVVTQWIKRPVRSCLGVKPSAPRISSKTMNEDNAVSAV